MKTYMEMANNVFRRVEAYKVAKQKQRTMFVRTGTAIGGAGLIALAGLGVWQQQADGTPPVSMQDSLFPGGTDATHDVESTTAITIPSSSSVTVPTTAVPDVPDDGKKLFVLNKIANTAACATRYFDPALHYQETWDAATMAAHLGVDLRKVAEVLPQSLAYIGTDTFTVTFKNDGTLVTDHCAVRFEGANGEVVTLLASRVGVPYDCMYMLETDQTTPLCLRSSGEIIDVLVGAAVIDKELYVADFAYDGANYRIKVENAPPLWIDRLIREIAGE